MIIQVVLVAGLLPCSWGIQSDWPWQPPDEFTIPEYLTCDDETWGPFEDHSHIWYMNDEYDVTEELPSGTLHPSLGTDNTCQALANLYEIILDEYTKLHTMWQEAYFLYYNYAEHGRNSTRNYGLLGSAYDSYHPGQMKQILHVMTADVSPWLCIPAIITLIVRCMAKNEDQTVDSMIFGLMELFQGFGYQNPDHKHPATFLFLDSSDWPLKSIDMTMFIEHWFAGRKPTRLNFNLYNHYQPRQSDFSGEMLTVPDFSSDVAHTTPFHFGTMTTHAINSEVVLALLENNVNSECKLYGVPKGKELAAGCDFIPIPHDLYKMLAVFTEFFVDREGRYLGVIEKQQLNGFYDAASVVRPWTFTSWQKWLREFFDEVGYPDLLTCTYPFLLCMAMDEVLPSSIPMVVFAHPPCINCDPEVQAIAANIFRTWASGNTERQLVLFTMVPFIKTLTEHMLGVDLPYVPFINRRHRRLRPALEFLPALPYHDDVQVNKTTGWASGVYRQIYTQEELLEYGYDTRNVRVMLSNLANGFVVSHSIALMATLHDILRLNAKDHVDVQFKFSHVFGAPRKTTLELAQAWSESDWGLMFPWDWELTTYMEWFGLNLPILVPSAPWMIALLRCVMYNSAGKWDMLRSEWQKTYVNATGWIDIYWQSWHKQSHTETAAQWYLHTDYENDEFVTHFHSLGHLVHILTSDEDRYNPMLLRQQIDSENRKRKLKADRFFRGVLEHVGMKNKNVGTCDSV